MNILILTWSLGIWWIERASQVFAQYLTKKEWIKVIFWTKDPYGPRKSFLEADWIEIIDVTKLSPDEIVSNYQIDVIFAHCYNTRDFAKFENVIRIQEVVFAWCYDENAHINFSISDALSYKVKLMRPNSNIITLYYPQDVSTWANLKFDRQSLFQKYNISTNKFIVSRIARAEPSKWDYIFIPSVKKFLDRNPDWHLLLVGCPFLYKFLLWNYRNRITYIQPTSDDQILWEVYTLTDVFFHTAQRWETFGNVIAEAMQFGKPVVTHSTHFEDKNWEIMLYKDNSQIEVCEHLENGFVGVTPDQIVWYLEMLKNDKQLYDKFSENNISKVKSTYEAWIVVDRFLEIIESYKNWTLKFETTEDFEEKYKSLLKFDNKKDKLYDTKLKIYTLVEYIYLVKRKLLRKIWIDLEKFKIFD